MATNTAAADGKTGKGRFKLIIIIVIAVLLAVGLSVAGTWFFLSKKFSENAASEPKEQVAAPVKQPAIYQDLQPAFVVNYNVQGRARYLQLSVALMSRDAAGMEKLKAHTPALRNRLVMLLADQDFSTLSTALGKEMLLQKALANVQELAQKETGSTVIEQVLFTNFVLQ